LNADRRAEARLDDLIELAALLVIAAGVIVTTFYVKKIYQILTTEKR
jgi:hypothetical protein